VAIKDINNSGRVAAKVAELEEVSAFEVEERAQEVVNAAVRARKKEFEEGGGYYTDPNTGESMPRLVDTATGKNYVYRHRTDQWETMEGQVVDDPRNVDPAQYQWVIEKFKYFHQRWPTFAGTLAYHSDEAKAAITSGRMAPIETVGDIVATGWGGQSRDNFKEFFLDPFGNAVTNQQQVLDELGCSMYAYEALLQEGQIDAKKTADETIKILDGLSESSPPDAETVIKVVAVVAGVVGVIASGGSGLIIGAGLVGAGTGAAELIAKDVSEQEKNRKLNGGTVDEVLEKMKGALDELKQDMETVEQNLAEAVGEVSTAVNGYLNNANALDVATILPNEPDNDVPDVTDGEVLGGDDFRPRQ
jgi:hypothetical protein